MYARQSIMTQNTDIITCEDLGPCVFPSRTRHHSSEVGDSPLTHLRRRKPWLPKVSRQSYFTHGNFVNPRCARTRDSRVNKLGRSRCLRNHVHGTYHGKISKLRQGQVYHRNRDQSVKASAIRRVSVGMSHRRREDRGREDREGEEFGLELQILREIVGICSV
jgi:hypothetical protein